MTAFKLSAFFAQGETRLPRFCELGDLTLDLFHHDGRVADQWLGLTSDEFEIMWRLARERDRWLTKPGIAAGCSNVLAHHGRIRRLRARLQPFGLADMIIACGNGRYELRIPDGPSATA